MEHASAMQSFTTFQLLQEGRNAWNAQTAHAMKLNAQVFPALARNTVLALMNAVQIATQVAQNVVENWTPNAMDATMLKAGNQQRGLTSATAYVMQT